MQEELPQCYQYLVDDPKSPVIDLCPSEVPVDTEGKRYASQGVPILPEMEEGRLRDVLQPLDAALTPEERARNTFGEQQAFVHETHPLGPVFAGVLATASETQVFMWCVGVWGCRGGQPMILLCSA